MLRRMQYLPKRGEKNPLIPQGELFTESFFYFPLMKLEAFLFVLSENCTAHPPVHLSMQVFGVFLFGYAHKQ